MGMWKIGFHVQFGMCQPEILEVLVSNRGGEGRQGSAARHDQPNLSAAEAIWGGWALRASTVNS